MEEALQAAAEASGGDLTIEQVTKLHEDQSAKMKEDAGDYMYNLAGILVHAGVAQGGHYYSYIRDRGKGAYEDRGGRAAETDRGCRRDAAPAGAAPAAANANATGIGTAAETSTSSSNGGSKGGGVVDGGCSSVEGAAAAAGGQVRVTVG